MHDQYFVYILTTRSHSVLYTGVTNNLWRRVFEHRAETVSGFTSRYHVDKLVYFQTNDHINAAIRREKQFKGGSRAKKIALINNTNLDWRDLYDGLVRYGRNAHSLFL